MINITSTHPIIPPVTTSRTMFNAYKQTLVQQTYEVLPAAEFTMEELTYAYNQTRVDYIVPMPMTTARLQAYSDAYDIDLSASVVIVDRLNHEMLGLGMLGIRNRRSWITRLGVLPSARGRKIGRVIMDELIAESERRGMTHIWLEVILGNKPAYNLFKKLGFKETRTLIVSRRAPAPVDPASLDAAVDSKVLDGDQILCLLGKRPVRPNWLNETETFANNVNLTGVLYSFANGGQGWVVYEDTPLQLKQVTVGVLHGDEPIVTAAVLRQLHADQPIKDAVFENISDTDPRWQGYQTAGYFDSFQRIEMVKKL